MLTFLLATLTALLFESVIFPGDSREYHDHELKPGEIIQFNCSPRMKELDLFQAHYQHGAFDHSAFDIVFKNKTVSASGIQGPRGRHQNELIIFQTEGEVTRSGDTLFVKSSSVFPSHYIFSIAKQVVVDSFSSKITVAVLSKTLREKYCPNRLTTSYSCLTINAIPGECRESVLWKPFHAKATVGYFSYFSITDSKGKTQSFPAGDYVIISGKVFNFSE